MKKRKREKLERKKATTAARQLPEWWVQGKSRVMEHFGGFIDDCLGCLDEDKFTCEGGCYHYLEGECEGKEYQGREVFECLKAHNCSILLQRRLKGHGNIDGGFGKNIASCNGGGDNPWLRCKTTIGNS